MEADKPQVNGKPASMAGMGKVIPLERRKKGLEHCKEMGLNTSESWTVVNVVAQQLERDKPYVAQQEGLEFLNATGVYRLFAVLLTPLEEE